MIILTVNQLLFPYQYRVLPLGLILFKKTCINGKASASSNHTEQNYSSSLTINSSVSIIKMGQNPNNSYALNKPYLRLKTVKTISHTYLISKKRRTIFPKINNPHIWLIRKWRVSSRGRGVSKNRHMHTGGRSSLWVCTQRSCQKGRNFLSYQSPLVWFLAFR